MRVTLVMNFHVIRSCRVRLLSLMGKSLYESNPANTDVSLEKRKLNLSSVCCKTYLMYILYLVNPSYLLPFITYKTGNQAFEYSLGLQQKFNEKNKFSHDVLAGSVSHQALVDHCKQKLPSNASVGPSTHGSSTLQ